MHNPLGLFVKKTQKKISRQGFPPSVSNVNNLPEDPVQEINREVDPVAIIRTADVAAALAPLLGARFVENTPLCQHAAEVLCLYDPLKMSLEALYPRLRDVIFGELYDALGQGMLLQLENGVRLRLRLRDVDTLTDEALGVLLDALPSAVLTLSSLRDYAMQTGSLSAMRVLLQRYGQVIPPMERDMLKRIIRENHPADRYQAWLDE